MHTRFSKLMWGTWGLFFFIILQISSITPLGAKTGKIVCFENPTPTCEEKIYVELKRTAEVNENLQTKEFLVLPVSAVADEAGNVFVYDAMIGKIFKYDKDLGFVKTFSGKGRGPGEISSGMGRGVPVPLYMGKDKLIYVGDRGNQKILSFNTAGELVKELKIHTNALTFIKPVLDRHGNFYTYSTKDGIIDVYNREGILTGNLGSRRILPYCLFYKLSGKLNRNLFYGTPGPSTILYDMVTDDKLLVYTMASGIMYLVKDNKPILSKKLWPKKLLNIYKKELKTAIGDDPKAEMYLSFFQDMAVDRDDENFFYLRFTRPKDDDKTYIYRFDIKGNLEKVLYLKERNKDHSKLLFKRNGLFYMVGENKQANQTLVIYREEKLK